MREGMLFLTDFDEKDVLCFLHAGLHHIKMQVLKRQSFFQGIQMEVSANFDSKKKRICGHWTMLSWAHFLRKICKNLFFM